MSATTYRFVGEAPEVFPDLTGGRIQVTGANHDPNAEDFQPPGELRPGQEFTGPEGLEHVRLERAGAGGWSPTIQPESPSEATPLDPPTAPPPVVPQAVTGGGDVDGDVEPDGSEA